MRIAFLADPLDRQYGGIQVYLKELLKAISQLDTQHEFLIVRPERRGEFKGMEEMVVPWKNFPGYRAWRLFVEIPRLLVKKQVDIVVEPAHFGPFNLPKNIKRITVIHDLTMFLFPDDHLFFSQFLQRKFLPRILKKATHIITNSKNTSKDLEHFFPWTKGKNTPVLLGKNEQYRPSVQPLTLLKYHLQQPYFLCIGTLEPRKNIPLLIQAFSQFKALTGLPHQLVLIGKEGWKTQEIFEAIVDSAFQANISVLGYVEEGDLPVFYSMATAFVYPSKYEGFGLPVLEAMACGAPVLTTKVSSLAEVGGAAAVYFTENSAADLSKKLEEIAGNYSLQEALKQRSLQQAAQFSWKKTAQKTLKIFDELVA